ncbi:nitroreductase [Bartonella apihabitans]|uniref:nitroreductase n=1 Tax=uncultured Bartonella sp. TaxID=104108 RepID=UPI0025E4F87F|nr:nitroreductase [Bartonella apihabitans]WLT09310.1 nitroreductase [Bartonella apihabitans]
MTRIEKFCDVVKSRKSIRAYLDKDVDRKMVEDILRLSSRAPSGANIQAWQVIVLHNGALKKLGQKLFDMSVAGIKEECEYQFYPRSWREPYLARRRKVGWDLYRSLGIARSERSKIVHQQAKNFMFFGAPVGLIFTMDRDMEFGSWLDLGCFIQTIALVARSYGLDSCIQAAFSEYHKTISEELQIPPERQVICGLALGYRDENAPENNFPTERVPLEDFVRFVD